LRLTKSSLWLAGVIALAACTTTAPPLPEVMPAGEDRYLIDPRTGTAETLPPPLATQFEGAWRYALAGQEAEALRRLGEVRRTSPEYPPATLLQAFLDIRAGRLDDARSAISRVQEADPENLPARVYQAEIALREGEVRLAYDLYRRISVMPGAPPTAAERVSELQGRLFNDLLAAAQNAPDAEAIRLLREALTFNAGAIEPRIQLAQKLVTAKQFDDARRELDPLLNTAPDRPEVQEILAEVDVGRGRYQEAIVRYDRLARRTKDERFARRLEDIKSEWSAANMPAHYRSAVESAAVTRAELAVLLYWTVPSVRFAQNLGTPQIAVDVEGLAGREEMIRAIALGLYDVDPVTRRVSPHRTVSAGRISQHLTRVLTLRGAPCARGLAQDKVLAACGVTNLAASVPPESTVGGREAQRALGEVAKALQ
jgi:tetratricopeptide (TPR) repeat protein